MVLSRLDYASQLWSPYLLKHIYLIEKVQTAFTKHITGIRDFSYSKRLETLKLAGPKVECGELNTKPMTMTSNKMSDAGCQADILGDGEGCLSGSKPEHTDIAASDLFNSLIVQNVGLIDLVESPSQPARGKTVVSCSCSYS